MNMTFVESVRANLVLHDAVVGCNAHLRWMRKLPFVRVYDEGCVSGVSGRQGGYVQHVYHKRVRRVARRQECTDNDEVAPSRSQSV